jgi:L-lactate dehydrogenase complex protein LldE
MRVSIFITCLADQFRPQIGRCMVRLFDRLDIAYDVPRRQTCCGQPAFNSGNRREAGVVARQFLNAFADAELIVAPSGSCAAMVKNYLPSLFAPGSDDHAAAVTIAGRIHELSEFLVDVLKIADVGATFPHRVALHPSCHLLRELGVRDAPRVLLRAVNRLELVPLPDAETCCGFGGMFSIKYPDISVAMGRVKATQVAGTGAEFVVANDTGCLMQMEGVLHRMGAPVGALHLAEILGHA